MLIDTTLRLARRRLLMMALLFSAGALAEAPRTESAAESAEERSEFTGKAQRGAEMAPLCENCHGPDGRSRTSRYPSIAGLSESRIIERMEAFRAGEGGHLMESMTRGLSDQDIADLAAYYSRLKAPASGGE